MSKTLKEASDDVFMPRLPRRVRVGARWYTISRVVRIDGADAWGMTSSPTNTIQLRDDVDLDHTPEILLHEIIHAITIDRDLEKVNDEHFICSLTAGLTAVLQDLGWLPTRLKLADDP